MAAKVRFVENPGFEAQLMASDGMRAFCESLANVVAASAKAKAPVRLGILRGNIDGEAVRADAGRAVGGWVGRVTSDDWKTLLIEHGTRRMRAQPFLVPAVIETVPGATFVRGAD